MSRKRNEKERILDWLVGQALKVLPAADPVLVRDTMKKLLDSEASNGP